MANPNQQRRVVPSGHAGLAKRPPRAGVKMQEECASSGCGRSSARSSTLTDWYEKGQKVMHQAVALEPAPRRRGDQLDEPAWPKRARLVQKAIEVRR